LPVKKKIDFMQLAITFSLTFTALVFVAAMVLRCFGIDTSHETTLTATVFGGELVLGILRVLSKDRVLSAEESRLDVATQNVKNAIQTAANKVGLNKNNNTNTSNG